jgi:predicted esterase
MNRSRIGRRAAICALSAGVLAITSIRLPRAGVSLIPASILGSAPEPAAAVVVAAPPAAPLPAVSAGRRQILVPDHSPIELYPPREPSERAPLTVMLHGMCSGPVDVCDFWSEDGRTGSWLACPAGNARCGGSFDWTGPTASRTAAVAAQLEAVEQDYGARLDHGRGDVLVGFSRGGFLARDLVYARPGVFRGVVFLGAAVRPDPRRFHHAGVRRVLLAAGDYDGAGASMQRSAGELAAGGVEARYVSLGRIGHALPADLGRVLREAIAWIREER